MGSLRISREECRKLARGHGYHRTGQYIHVMLQQDYISYVEVHNADGTLHQTYVNEPDNVISKGKGCNKCLSTS